MFDLAGYIAARLKRAGITAVEDVGLCTYADPERFFSYRRTTHRAEADYGRHVNAIALAGR
jgi:copper oxidase (laccase) domain-containing protein